MNETILPDEFPAKSSKNNLTMVIENSTKEGTLKVFSLNFIPRIISTRADNAHTTG